MFLMPTDPPGTPMNRPRGVGSGVEISGQRPLDPDFGAGRRGKHPFGAASLQRFPELTLSCSPKLTRPLELSHPSRVSV